MARGSAHTRIIRLTERRHSGFNQLGIDALGDHKALADDDEFCWTPDAAADFVIRSKDGGIIKFQSTMAYRELPNSVAKQGGHLHKLEMIQFNKEGHCFPGGLVSQPNSLDVYTDVETWQRGIAGALKNKLRPEYSELHLLIFARGCRFNTIDFPFEQVVMPAIDQAGVAECERIFGGLYVFDDQPPAFFELKRV